jgi:predicted dinucleotide-binding enzyme
MKIGIIGAGMIGATTARLFARSEHDVAVANTRGHASLAELVREIGPRARAATVDDAAAFGEIVFLAIPFGQYGTLPAERLAGKIVVDAMNYYPQRDGELALNGLTSSELVARQLRGARLVKAFNTMYFQTLATRADPSVPLDERLALFLAGDDAAAKAEVARLIEQIGFAPVDTGSLCEGGRKQQPGTPIYNVPLTAAAARAVLAGA